ncbi:hypothetical protein CCACVL1_03444 [Corchorus capsularis]|uniref:Biotin/lipoyl attachment n=1 Tax=Corchorus capsularis TaxID=210143 RepID=A0A1R3JZA7_COCAP|nr:hypothetical protein CCACVL1_03444 [Corchorus capsularis]
MVTIDAFSPHDGVLQECVAKEGDTVEPGTKIAIISKSVEGVAPIEKKPEKEIQEQLAELEKMILKSFEQRLAELEKMILKLFEQRLAEMKKMILDQVKSFDQQLAEMNTKTKIQQLPPSTTAGHHLPPVSAVGALNHRRQPSLTTSDCTQKYP